MTQGEMRRRECRILLQDRHKLSRVMPMRPFLRKGLCRRSIVFEVRRQLGDRQSHSFRARRIDDPHAAMRQIAGGPRDRERRGLPAPPRPNPQ